MSDEVDHGPVSRWTIATVWIGVLALGALIVSAVSNSVLIGALAAIALGVGVIASAISVARVSRASGEGVLVTTWRSVKSAFAFFFWWSF